MKTEWDYTELAEAYLKRPGYAPEAIDVMAETSGIQNGASVCDVGAGAAHLTLLLASKAYRVYAVEPNDAMRTNGIKRTAGYANVSWFEGVGEATGMPDSKFELVTFGSSFNVCDRPVALAETARILKSGGWFACMWNWRDLKDNTQMQIEEIITNHISDYDYGLRREDQTEIINASGLFGPVKRIVGTIIHRIPTEDFVDGWRSHATLHRQSNDKFDLIITEISKVVESAQNDGLIDVPYTTHIWMAQNIT
jgi:SAM-dependent methyltransferase